jgi:hypothetical protein
MSTQWTMEMMEDAKRKHEFILVGGPEESRVIITDATRLWATDPNILFQTESRIAGSSESITEILSNADVEDVKMYVDSSINSENYLDDMNTIYKSEVDAYNLWRRGIIKANIDSPGAKLFDIMYAIDPDLLGQSKNQKDASVMSITKRKAGSKTVKSLIDKLNNLAADKVLDVSGLKPDGTGTKSIPPPVRRGKYGSPRIPMVSSTFDNYVMAIRMLPGGEDQFVEDIEYVREQFYPSTIGDVSQNSLPRRIQPSTITQRVVSQSDSGIMDVPRGETITPLPTFPVLTKREWEKKKEKDTVASLQEHVTTMISLTPGKQTQTSSLPSLDGSLL